MAHKHSNERRDHPYTDREGDRLPRHDPLSADGSVRLTVDLAWLV
jgi:hypothetical protein